MSVLDNLFIVMGCRCSSREERLGRGACIIADPPACHRQTLQTQPLVR